MPSAPKTRTPRPRNSFILYRSNRIAEMKSCQVWQGVKQSGLSRVVGKEWKAMSSEHPIKKLYEAMAHHERLEHRRLNPDYRVRIYVYQRYLTCSLTQFARTSGRRTPRARSRQEMRRRDCLRSSLSLTSSLPSHNQSLRCLRSSAAPLLLAHGTSCIS